MQKRKVKMANPIVEDQEVVQNFDRAVDGEKVWVLLNQVKPDKSEAFEQFMHKIIKPITEQTEPEVLYRTRILHPTQPNEDGTLTYVFLMDPVVPDGEYNFEKILLKAYSPEETKNHLEILGNCLVSPQVSYEVIQKNW
jgi:hypothetical protein